MTRPKLELVIAVGLALSLGAPARARADAKQDALAEMEKAQENLDRGEYDAAIARFHVARSLAPQSSGPYLGLGLAHARAGRCVEAVPFLEEYVKRKGHDAKPEGVRALEECKKRVPGRLELDSQPPGAEVRLDDPSGPVLGTTPLQLTALPEGKHVVFFTKPGWKPAQAEVTIRPAQTTRTQLAMVAEPPPEPAPAPSPEPAPPPVAPRPEPPPVAPVAPPASSQPGQLTVDVAPASATLSLNGVQVGAPTSHFESKMVPGAYTVLAEREGFRSVIATVQVENGQKVTKELRLQPLRRSTWLGLAIPFSLVAVGSGIGAIVTFYAADGHPRGASFDSNATANKALQAVCYPSIALAATGYLLYGVLNRGRIGDGPPLRVSLAPLRNGAAAALQLRF